MRFSIAVGILAQALVSSSKTEKKTVLWSRNSGRHNRLQSSLVKNGAISSKVPRHNAAIESKHAVLHNAVTSSMVVECDPTSSDPDVGLLSCGIGRFCMESIDHDLGGLCTDEPIAVDTHRALQIENVEGLTSLCNTTSDYYGVYDCDCTNWDSASTTGNFECVFFDSFCFDPPANTVCASTILAAEFASASTYSVSYCYDFFSPYDQSVCYNYDSAGACSIDFNDMACNSCEQEDIGGVDNPTGEYCLVFDCTNTDGMHEGSECVGDYVALILETISTPSPVDQGSSPPSSGPGMETDVPASSAPVASPTEIPVADPTMPPATDPPVASPTDMPVADPTMPPATSAPVDAPPPETDSPVADPTMAPVESPVAVPTMPEMSMSMSMSMNMNMNMMGRRELDELFDSEFGQDLFGRTTKRVAENTNGSRRIRKRL